MVSDLEVKYAGLEVCPEFMSAFLRHRVEKLVARRCSGNPGSATWDILSHIPTDPDMSMYGNADRFAKNVYMFEEQLDLPNIRANAKEIASDVFKVEDKTFFKVTIKSQGVGYTIVGVSALTAPTVRALLLGESCPRCYDDFSKLSDISKPD